MNTAIQPLLLKNNIKGNWEGAPGDLIPERILSGGVGNLSISKGGNKLTRIALEINLVKALDDWSLKKVNLWPIHFYLGIFDENTYYNRYLSLGMVSDGKVDRQVIFLNKAYITKDLEQHMLAVVAWALVVKKMRSLGLLKRTFYHEHSGERRVLENFAATSFTTLMAARYSGLEEKFYLPKQVHTFKDLNPAYKLRLIQIYAVLFGFIQIHDRELNMPGEVLECITDAHDLLLASNMLDAKGLNKKSGLYKKHPLLAQPPKLTEVGVKS